MNYLFLEKDNRKVLIDTGAGGVFGDDSGHLLENLLYAGIQPEEITDIIITHAHPDHVGGLSDKYSNPVYPNADVYISDIEYKYWMNGVPDFSESTMTDKDHLDMLVHHARKNLSAVKEKLHIIKWGSSLFDFIELLPAPGHTPGQTIIRIHSGQDEMYHIADVVHSEIISFEHPEWIYNSDSDYKRGIETRIQVLDKLAGKRIRFFACHLPWPGIGFVKKCNSGYEWIPQRVAMPY